QSRLELHGIDTHHATSLASGDSSIHPARRRSCDRRLMVRANQVVLSEFKFLSNRVRIGLVNFGVCSRLRYL
ncbi:hypothetical protein, partial [Xanthomonas hortorum]|uniref:hypothetical protein n=1 Tax=Xanthomonas hortorum TaxID=56454 RepID=UPI001F33E9AE